MRQAARLRRSTDIAAVRAEGRSLRKGVFSVRARPTDEPLSRLAVTAPRSVGTAVRRNRARRRVREAFRREFASMAPGRSIDLLITLRPEAARADFPAIEADVRALLVDLAR